MGRNKKTIEGKSPFKLRRRLLKDGRTSLFIDHFMNNKHEYEFLKLYLLPETSEQNRRENRKTIREAEDIIRRKREEFIRLNKTTRIGDTTDEITLSGFIDILIKEYKKEGKTGFKHFMTSRTNLEKFNGNVVLTDIDTQFCISYYNWLKNCCVTSKGKHLSEIYV